MFHLRDFYNVSMSKYTLITEYFNITVNKFQQWERPLWANLETQLWLPGLVRFIKIYETANIWISGVLVFFQHLDSQTDRRSAWICSWRGSTSTFPESHPIFCVKKRLWCEPWAYLPLFSSCVRPLQRPFYLSLTSDQKLRWEISKRAKKKRGGKRRGLSQWETSLVVSHSIQDILSWWAENRKPRKKPSSSNLQLSTLW